MKKLVSLLFIIFIGLFSLTGCTIVRIDTSDFDNISNIILSKENSLYNHIGKGYKYYIPKGVTYIDTNEFNDKLYSNGNYYYLYIDAISYYYQKDFVHSKGDDLYYYKDIDINGKKGYIEITRYNDKFLIDFMFNYAHIESLVPEEDIRDVLLNSSYILSTIKFNSKVIRIMLNEDYFKYKEEKFQLYDNEQENDNFLNYSE